MRGYQKSGIDEGIVCDNAMRSRGRWENGLWGRVNGEGVAEIVVSADDSSWHHVFTTSFQDDDGGGDVGAGRIRLGDAVMRITCVQAASGSAFWSSVKADWRLR